MEWLWLLHASPMSLSDRGQIRTRCRGTPRSLDIQTCLRGRGILRVSLRNDGKLVAAVIRDRQLVQNKVAVWDVESGELLGTRPGHDARFSPNGRWLTVARLDHGVEVFDADSLEDFTSATPINYRRGDSVRSSCALSDGRTVLYSGRQSGLIRVWDVSANREVATLRHGQPGTTD